MPSLPAMPASPLLQPPPQPVSQRASQPAHRPPGLHGPHGQPRPLRLLRLPTRPLRRGLVLVAAGLLAGCASAPPPAPPPPLGLAEVVARPGERALLDGIRAYDDGQYVQAEAALQRALQAGLQSPRDQAHAHKLLAFISCTSERLAACEAAFRAARQADPGFALSRAEAGHPLWGPVYQGLSR